MTLQSFCFGTVTVRGAGGEARALRLRDVTDRSATTVPLDQTDALGARLRRLRQGQRVSLRELARRVGVSASAISQIELGRLQPSVNRLVSIVNALDVPLAEVFPDHDAADDDGETVQTAVPGPLHAVVHVSRAGEVEPVTLSTGVIYRRLSPGALPGLEWFESTYPPRSSACPVDEFMTHPGVESGYLQSGTLVLVYDDGEVEMHPGDAVSHPAWKPHRIENRSATEPGVMLWITRH